MFYCDNCDKEVKEKDMVFNYEDNTFKHKECGFAVEYREK